MPLIEGIHIKNFRTLKDVTLGKLWDSQTSKGLTPLTAVIGKNGVGKSSLFDAFGFLSDCLKTNVEEACDMRGRGGFERLRSMGQEGPIEFEIYYREISKARPITYSISIDLDYYNRPFVLQERLRQRREKQTHGRPFSFLILEKGSGLVWKGNAAGTQKEEYDDIFGMLKNEHNESNEELSQHESVELSDNRKLGIATLGALTQHPRISSFRRFIEGWYLSYFTPDAARGLPLAGPQQHLNIHGDNLGNVVQFMEREHSAIFDGILKRIANKIPGIKKIDTKKTDDGRLLLRFTDKGFHDPFYSQQISDGTLKLFAYMLLLEDPSPPPFLCIEEPENGLYHKLLEVLADEFREKATSTKNGTQIFVTTHQPYFVNSLMPSEVWILSKDVDGFAEVKRASDINLIQNLVDEGIPLGNLWYSDYLDKSET